jgi:tetratricopeptide (TPR) repeat protein
MKRYLWLALAAFALVVVGVTLVAVPTPAEWTTTSPDSLAEFEEGIADLKKIYFEEALEHFERALELDPGFLVAKLRVAQLVQEQNQERAEHIAQELMDADLSGLTPREKFFIEYWRALRHNREDDAARILDRCLEENPNDPYVVGAKAGAAWQQGRLNEAERLYQLVLEIDPNWAVAYNALGYISMMKSEFNEAEQHFKRYRFIAPDQANPHDSLGELFVTTGRYDDAETSFEKALEVKPGFWASYEHLLVLKIYSGDFDAIPSLIERAENAGMTENTLFDMRCQARYAALADRQVWQQIVDESDHQCVTDWKSGLAAIVTHRAACRTGDWELAQSIEDQATEMLISLEDSGIMGQAAILRAAIYHIEAVRLAVQGNLEAAEKRFRAADEVFSFVEVGRGMFKLQNRLFLAETLLAGGNDVAAHKTLDSVRTTNPRVVRRFEDGGFRLFGLGRGQIPRPEAVATIDPREGPSTSL